MSRTITIIFLLLLIITGARAQSDTIKATIPDSVLEKQHSPTKATIMSALLPGLGQVYNKKYWKVPVIYAGFTVLGYFIISNASEYNKYRIAYNESATGDSTGKYPDLVKKYTAQNLQSAREYYRRNLEVSVLLSAVWYILNILDATVDAHLFSYNISTNLTLRVEPVIVPSYSYKSINSGIKLSLKF